MFNIIKERMTHAGRLERWLGTEIVEQLSSGMKDWYGPPIAVAGVPGNVWAMPGGDFRGIIGSGQFMGALDYAEDRLKNAYHKIMVGESTRIYMNAGFASLSDLIAEASAGKRQERMFAKSGTSAAIGAAMSLWRIGTWPSSGSAAAAAPGGTAFTNATAGALAFSTVEGAGDTLHFVSGYPLGSALGNLLLYDRLFGVARTMTVATSEAVTGVPTRYQSTVSTAADSAAGNFLFFECGTVLPATAHTYTTCIYTDQAGNTLNSLPALVGNSANVANRLDHPVNAWFAPLAAGDTGIKALTETDIGASSMASGAIDCVIGHPIAFMPVPIINIICVADGINSAFNLTRIFDNACLAFLDLVRVAATGVVYQGNITAVAG